MRRMMLALALVAAAPAAAADSAVEAKKMRAADGSHVLTHEMTIDAPVADIWAAISTAEGWKSWAVPTAWVPAGAPDVIETSYSADARPDDPSTIKQQVLLRIAPRLMVFRTIKAPARFPDFDTYSKVVSAFELEPSGDGRTRVRLTGTGYADSEAGRRLLGFFEKGNAVSLQALAKRFGGAATAAPVQSGLAPLAFLVGHCWRGDFPGGKQDTHCFESVYGGRHIRDRHEVSGSGEPYRGETIYSWNGKAKRVEYTYWNSLGGVSRGSMTPRADRLDFGNERYTGSDGKTITISTFWRRVGDDSYEAVSTSSPSPTGQRVTRYRRID
jgi:uncharacterized protein YndB with AHSA1/START domain